MQQLGAVLQVLIYVTGRRSVGWGRLSEPTQRSIVLAAQCNRSAPQTSLCSAPFFNAHCTPHLCHPLSLSSFSCIHPSPASGAGGFRVSMDSWLRPAVLRAFHRAHMHTPSWPCLSARLQSPSNLFIEMLRLSCDRSLPEHWGCFVLRKLHSSNASRGNSGTLC